MFKPEFNKGISKSGTELWLWGLPNLRMVLFSFLGIGLSEARGECSAGTIRISRTYFLRSFVIH